VVGDNRFILLPKTITDKEDSLEFALLKLPNLKTTKDTLQRLLNQSGHLQQQLNRVYKSQQEAVLRDRDLATKNAEILDYITRYRANILFAKKLYSMIYADRKPQNVIATACIGQYFSIESYYTPSTFAVVVMELQDSVKGLKLQKSDYVCSVIENLGDFCHHVASEKQSTDEKSRKLLFLKYSKYVYRILYSLEKATNKNEGATSMESKVVKYRGSKEIDKVDYTAFPWLEPTMSVKEYCTVLVQTCINKIDFDTLL